MERSKQSLKVLLLEASRQFILDSNKHYKATSALVKGTHYSALCTLQNSISSRFSTGQRAVLTRHFYPSLKSNLLSLSEERQQYSYMM